jgi:hypothetical protein
MANTIITKNSATATAVPTAGQLVQGELAVNVTDKRLFTENSGGTVVEVGTNPSTIAVAGNATVGGTLGVTGLATLASSTLTANPTLSAGTANGVTYLNGSKVLTSGSALTTNGSSLGVGSSDFGGAGSINVSVGVAGTTTGGLQLWSTTTGQHYVQFGDGTAGAATYAGAIGYSHATDQMFFYANGSEQMRLTSTGLGIGTSSPAYKLDVNGTSNFSGNMNLTATSNINWNGGDVAISNSGTNLVFKTYSGSLAERMRLDSSGNLGLGVAPSAAWASSPYLAAQFGYGGVIMSSAVSVGVTVFNTGANFKYDGSDYRRINAEEASQYQQASGAHNWRIAASSTANSVITWTQAMTLDASGNLLVGTTSLYGGEKLALVQSTNNRGFVIQQTNASNTSPPFLIDCSRNTTNETYNALAYYNSGAGAYRFYVTDNGGGYFNGNVGIGTSSPDTLLNIQGVNPTLLIQDSDEAGDGFIKFQTANGTQRGFIQTAMTADVMLFGTGTSERMRIESSGNLLVGGTSNSNNCRFVVTNTDSTRTWGFGTSGSNTPFYVLDNTTGSGVYLIAGGTSWTGTSDERYKTDLKAIENAAQKVSMLRAVTGRFKTDAEGTSRAFLIAQDVQAVLPEAVDANNPERLGVAYTDVIPLLVAAIKELKAINDAQAQTIESLKARLDAANI